MTGAGYGLDGQFWLLESAFNKVFDYVQLNRQPDTENKQQTVWGLWRKEKMSGSNKNG